MTPNHDLDAVGARIYGDNPTPASRTTTEADGGLWPREDDDLSAARLDAIAERLYR